VSTRISIAVVALFTMILGLTGIGTASAAPSPAPSPCAPAYFDISLGEGVEAFCDGAPGRFQVIAQCADGVDVWSVPGSLARAGEGPSVALCRGIPLFPAYVVSYFVVE
jgi:hypothetical protein